MNTILVNVEKAGANVFTSFRNSLFVTLKRKFKEVKLKFQASQFSKFLSPLAEYFLTMFRRLRIASMDY